MKTNPVSCEYLWWLWIMAPVTLILTGVAQAAPLPAATALPAGSATVPGFRLRVAQAPMEAVVANNASRAVQQLNGTLSDPEGTPYLNEAEAGPNPDGSFVVPVINFEITGTGFDLTDYASGFYLTSFIPELFPGIPGTNFHTDNFAVEVMAYLDLPAGVHTFGVSVGTDRTDVNNDDSFAVFSGRNPRDLFALKVGEFSRNGPPPFTGNTRNENQFTVETTVAGIYPFRLLYWQTGLGSNLQWYTIVNDERILINDLQNPLAIKSYSTTSVADANGPFLSEARPVSGSAGNSSTAAIEAVIVDGTTTVVPASMEMRLNGASVVPATTRTAPLTKVVFAPDADRTNPENAIRLNYTDSGGTAWQHEWAFGINVSGGSGTTATGQWDFESGNLAATIGQPLQYLDGPDGLTQSETKFGTTTALGVPDIGGKVANIMEVPGLVTRDIGYVMNHGIAPNGGGTRVNQYTLIMDVLVDTEGPGAAALLQTGALANTDDGDLFWQGNNFGQGTDGYRGTGQFTAGAWHRVIAAYDLAATPPVVTKYVDGIKQDDWTANQALDSERRAMLPAAILFADGDQDERRRMWVSSIQVRSGKLTDAEMMAMGGPSADGIPLTLPPTSVTGQWDFDSGNLAASAGKPLAYLDGAGGMTETGTAFGLCSELELPLIGDEDARVMKVPGDLSRDIGYIMDHGIKPNGGGTRVNQFTLVMDILVSETGPGAAALLQTNPGNTGDGDLFWQGNNFGQGTDGYIGTGQFTAGAWHRVVAAYDMAATPPVVTKYVDGIKQHDWTANQGLDAERRALEATAVLFGDGDQDERREMFVNSIQIREGKLTDAEIYQLGFPQASGIPVAIPFSPVSGQWDFELGNLAASIGKNLAYFDGADGLTQTGTVFGLCSELGVAPVNGRDSRIMMVPGDLMREIGYVMDHGIKPNGGGTLVNQYTLAMDVMVSDSGPGAAALLQLSSLTNADDGDLFWQGSNFGQGTDGYIGTGEFIPGAWHRVIAAYDMAANPPVVTKFVNGIKQHDWTANQGLDNTRRAMQPSAILFADGDMDERRVMWVNSIQIRAGKMTDEEMALMGSPDGGNLPVGPVDPNAVELPETTVLTVGPLTAGSFLLSWPSISSNGTVCILETSDTMAATTWTVVPTTTNSIRITPEPGIRYYRIRY